jgi:hypothetical protein
VTKSNATGRWTRRSPHHSRIPQNKRIRSASHSMAIFRVLCRLRAPPEQCLFTVDDALPSQTTSDQDLDGGQSSAPRSAPKHATPSLKWIPLESTRAATFLQHRISCNRKRPREIPRHLRRVPPCHVLTAHWPPWHPGQLARPVPPASRTGQGYRCQTLAGGLTTRPGRREIPAASPNGHGQRTPRPICRRAPRQSG